MSTQYRDDTFSEIEGFGDALETFNNALDSGTAKAFHVGTKAEIAAEISLRKADKMSDLEDRLRNIEQKIQEAKSPIELADKVPCMHDSCTECSGTGIRRFGGPCVHALSCPCPKCTPTC